jgi:hypothetical protein
MRRIAGSEVPGFSTRPGSMKIGMNTTITMRLP